MKIYMDLVLLLNFSYDFLLLLTVDITLKRHMKIYRHIISALLGSLAILILFLPLSSYYLFLLKIIISVIMIIISFGYKNIIINIAYLYMCSIILGGFLYLLNNQFNYNNNGLLFIFKGFNCNYLVLLIIAPIILYFYIKEHKRFLSSVNYSYQIRIIFKNNKELVCNGFIDTGNKLRDPFTKKYIILISKKQIIPYINIRSPIYVPCKTINNSSLVECFPIRYLRINNQILTNYLVGIIENNSSECILNYHLLEDLCLEK